MDVQPVLNAIAKTAARLCDANDAMIWQVKGDRLRLVAKHGSVRTTFAVGELQPIPPPSPAKQTPLLKPFADQAAIARENARLNIDLTEALEQQTATSEILRVISSSPDDLQPTFRTILASAARLCEAHLGLLYRYDGEVWTALAFHGANP